MHSELVVVMVEVYVLGYADEIVDPGCNVIALFPRDGGVVFGSGRIFSHLQSP